MIYFIIIAVLVFGILIYVGNKRYKNYDGYVVNKNYIRVPATMTKFENELLTLINDYRKSININEITMTDSFVRSLAENHCKYMIKIHRLILEI